MIAKYNIPEKNLATLRAKLEILNRRAVRLGVPKISLTETGKAEIVETKDENTGLVLSVTRILEVELCGVTPKFNGWTFAATLEHTEEGNIIRKVPSVTVDLSSYVDARPVCQHCNLIRNRKDTYVVLHDSGGLKQVGHDCVRDFLGHASPHSLAEAAELLMSAGELCGLASDDGFEGGGREVPRIYVGTLLAYTARFIRQYGFVSGKAEREAEESGSFRPSTKTTVLDILFPPKNPEAKRRLAEKHCVEGESWPTPSQGDKDVAEKARQFVLTTLGEPNRTLSEFESNLLICAKLEAIEFRTAGIACYIVEYYRREMEKLAQRANDILASSHFGIVGTRVRGVELTYGGCSSFESQWGMTFYHRFTTETGAALLWKTGTALNYADGFKVKATFSITEHGEFRGVKQTIISRVKFN